MKLFLLFLFIFTISIYPDNNIKLGILTKHNITELNISLLNSKLFFRGQDKKIEDGTWNIKWINSKLVLNKENEIIQGEHFKISTDKPFTISLVSKNIQLERTYKGSLELYSKKSSILLILNIPLEEYVSSSTNSELGELLHSNQFSSISQLNELIAAQEIVIRTYILKEKKRHFEVPYDFCDLTHCVHFDGIKNKKSIHPNIILSGDSNLNGYFHSTCGGNLTGPEVFWSTHKYSSNFHRGKDGTKPNCSDSPHFNWKSIFNNQELELIFNNHITSLSTVTLDDRVKSIKYSNEWGEKKDMHISVFFSKTGKLFGWNKIKSNDFKIEKVGSNFIFYGKGLGHGIGFCQWGAKYLASIGKNYKEILNFYFPDSNIVEDTGL